MAANKPAWMRDLDDEQIDYMLSLSREATVCKGRNRHRFPPMLPDPKTGLLPDSFDVQIVSGVVQVFEHCEICSRWIRRITDERGVIDYGKGGEYGGGEAGYIATGLNIPRHVYALKMAYDQSELIAERVKLIKKQGREAKARQRAEKLAARAS